MPKSSESKSIFITGANGGMGKEVCKILPERGFDRIVMTARSGAKLKAAQREIVAATQTSGATIEAYSGFDMLNASAIKSAVEGLPKDQKFDVVFLNAGGMIVSDGFETHRAGTTTIEKTVFQNVMGAHLTLVALKEKDLLADNVRVVIAGGEGARGLPGFIERPEFNDAEDMLNYLENPKTRTDKYNPFNALGTSKFMAALWVQKLSEQTANGMEVIWFSPGFTYGTDGVDDMPQPKRFFMANIMLPMMGLLGKAQSCRAGAEKFADCLSGKHAGNGDLVGAPAGTALGPFTDQTPMHPAFSDRRYRDAFWSLVEKACGPWPVQASGN